jgi:LPXTG-motif cell wall-anchored protein
MEALLWVGIALVAFGLAGIVLKKRKESAYEPNSEQVILLETLVEEQEKTNELLRQLIRAYGHEPEA